MKQSPTNEEAFVSAVEAKLKEEQRSVAWLSRQIGAHPSTVGYQLKRPATITLRHALAISEALGVEL